jgi:membrane-associated protease RseP (regulator of RpoE activity)
VTIKVRRDGKARDIPVVVADAPPRILQRRMDEMRDVQTPWIPRGFPRAPEAPTYSGMTPPTPVRAGSPPVPPRTAYPGFAPLPPMAPSFTFVTNGVAGAVMVTVSEGLGKSLGVQSGVLIASAPASSPAAEAGLRDGDVLVRVAGEPVRSVNDVRARIGRAGDNGERSVTIEFMREKRMEKTTLRW